MNGDVVGYAPGSFDPKHEAYIAAANLARLDWAEGSG